MKSASWFDQELGQSDSQIQLTWKQDILFVQEKSFFVA